MKANTLTENKSIVGLQYLRGIAALMVVFFHARSYFDVVPLWSQIGSRGVDIFFVISGFIMAYTTRHASTDISAAKASYLFLSKRIIRVVPLYWIALLWTSSAYWLNWIANSHSPGELYANLTPDMIAIFKDFIFIPHLSIDEGEQGEIFPVLIQGWTLNFEMFFYALFGLSLFYRQYRLVSVSLVLVTLVIIGQMNHFKTVIPLFYTSSSLIEFVLGIFVFEIYMKTQHKIFDRKSLAVVGLIGFLLLNSGSRVNDKFVLGMGAVIIVWVFIHAFHGSNIRPLKILGDASYSIYLFHAAVFVAFRGYIKHLELDSSSYVNIVFIIMGQVLAGVAVGILVYYIIERPLLKILRNVSERIFLVWNKS